MPHDVMTPFNEISELVKCGILHMDFRECLFHALR
jgi:hypothetical protein